MCYTGVGHYTLELKVMVDSFLNQWAELFWRDKSYAYKRILRRMKRDLLAFFFIKVFKEERQSLQ